MVCEQTDMQEDVIVQKDDIIFDHCHLVTDYIVIQVCMWTSVTTISVCHVWHVYAHAARLLLLSRAQNSQPVIGKGARRAAAAAAAAAAAQRSAPLRLTSQG